MPDYNSDKPSLSLAESVTQLSQIQGEVGSGEWGVWGVGRWGEKLMTNDK
jgi:hypothetical protein